VASPKTTTNGPSQSHNSPLNSVGNHLINAEGMLARLLYKSTHGANLIPGHHLQQPMRHSRQCGTHTITPLSSRTNVCKYSYFPRTVDDWNALHDSASSAPSSDSFRAALHRLSTPLHPVRLKVEIHEIQFLEVTNYRNPPPISRNPHANKRNPTPATKSTATPPKANYRNLPAFDGVCLRMAVLCCHVQSSTHHSERWHTSKSIRLALIIAHYPSHRQLIQPGWRFK